MLADSDTSVIYVLHSTDLPFIATIDTFHKCGHWLISGTRLQLVVRRLVLFTAVASESGACGLLRGYRSVLFGALSDLFALCFKLGVRELFV